MSLFDHSVLNMDRFVMICWDLLGWSVQEIQLISPLEGKVNEFSPPVFLHIVLEKPWLRGARHHEVSTLAANGVQELNEPSAYLQ